VAADLGAAAATRREVEPLAVSFGRLTALRMSRDGELLACDADAKQVYRRGLAAGVLETRPAEGRDGALRLGRRPGLDTWCERVI
jgi:hypothetical protein